MRHTASGRRNESSTTGGGTSDFGHFVPSRTESPFVPEDSEGESFPNIAHLDDGTSFRYRYINDDEPRPKPFVPGSRTRVFRTPYVTSPKPPPEIPAYFRSENIPQSGRRREAARRPDGSIYGFEEIVDPEDVRANSDARNSYIREYHQWDNDRYDAEIQRERDRQRHEERMNLYTDKNFLDYSLQKEKEKNRHEEELRRAEREEEMKTQRFLDSVEIAYQRAKKTHENKLYAATPDLFGQLLEELHITPDALRGNGYLSGFCASRSTLYQRNYLYTILFYGVTNVKKGKKSNEIVAYYSDNLPETININRPGLQCRPHINFDPGRRICIVDVTGYPEPKKSFFQKLNPFSN